MPQKICLISRHLGNPLSRIWERCPAAAVGDVAAARVFLVVVVVVAAAAVVVVVYADAPAIAEISDASVPPLPRKVAARPREAE